MCKSFADSIVLISQAFIADVQNPMMSDMSKYIDLKYSIFIGSFEEGQAKAKLRSVGWDGRPLAYKERAVQKLKSQMELPGMQEFGGVKLFSRRGVMSKCIVNQMLNICQSKRVLRKYEGKLAMTCWVVSIQANWLSERFSIRRFEIL